MYSKAFFCALNHCSRLPIVSVIAFKISLRCGIYSCVVVVIYYRIARRPLLVHTSLPHGVGPLRRYILAILFLVLFPQTPQPLLSCRRKRRKRMDVFSFFFDRLFPTWGARPLSVSIGYQYSHHTRRHLVIPRRSTLPSEAYWNITMMAEATIVTEPATVIAQTTMAWYRFTLAPICW